MTDKLWKAVERQIANYIGGARVPITGRQRGDTPDVKHPDYAIEVKHRAKFPLSWTDAMDQAHKASKPGQLPIVIWHAKHNPHGEDLVMLRLCDFRAWFG